MVNEMGNNKSSQQANHGDDIRGRNRINREGEGKDLHEKVEGLSADKQPKGGDPPGAKQASDDKEQEETKLTLSSQSTEVLPIESSDAASQDSIIQPAASPAGRIRIIIAFKMGSYTNTTHDFICVESDFRKHATEEVEASNSTPDTGSELLGSSITDDRQETEAKDEAENGFDNKCSEAISLGTSSNNIEEAPQTQDKSMPLSENKDKMDVSENEDAKQAVNESNTDEVDSSQSGLVIVDSDSGNGKENVENIELTETTAVMETVPTELPATEGNNEEEEMKEKVIEAIEKQEHDTGTFPSAGNEAEVSGAVEHRKSPSFDFDLSTGARPGESVQTPLLHHNKNRTGSLSMFDGSNGVENLTQDEAVSAEEKTIEVARSDSDRSRATLLNFLKEGEGKGNVAVEPQKQDCEKKGEEESWTGTIKEVALAEESGFEWLNMAYEIGNSNVSGLKELLPIEPSDTTGQDSAIQDAASPKDHWKETESNLDNLWCYSSSLPWGKFASSLLLKVGLIQDHHRISYIDFDFSKHAAEAVEASNSTCRTESELLGMSINGDRQETETKEEVENGFCSEVVPTEVNFSKNGSSKPAQETSSLGTSSNSNTFEQVPQTQDKSMTVENKKTVKPISRNEDTKRAVNESKTNGVSSSQSELMMVGSDSGNGKENVENGELIEMTPIMETVQTELPTTECNNVEEAEQTEGKIIEGTKEEKENFLDVGISIEAIEKPELDTGIFQGAGNEAVDIAVDELSKPLRFINSDLSMKAKLEESDQAPLLHHKKTRTRSLSMVFAEEKTIDIAVDELRKSLRFNFDLSMEAKSEEPDQTSSVQHKKTRTRGLSIPNDDASFGNEVQNQAVSAEEKTIEVDRSDSDKSGDPFLIFLMKDEEKGNVAAKPKEQDYENKGVDESWTGRIEELVAVTKGKGKRNPRPSLFTCVCCVVIK
ncbi:hypothetical protein RHSIM_Rhsim04G0196200 [Rhododendron simsii]|uniref:Uncharacterized protein n=1 Tax=Rhododendron simsii TaxID=118357 RepID=A0A834H6K5_RHOSS|nr:hypothetical protein RHSIM_Rhsim04G0196200 [Rhododendron simsii]